MYQHTVQTVYLFIHVGSAFVDELTLWLFLSLDDLHQTTISMHTIILVE
jgi:hypothetical protein